MGNLSINKKINIFTTIGLVILVSLLTIFVYYDAKDTIIEEKFKKLTAIKVAKKSEVENYFNSVENLLVSLATNEGTVSALLQFELGFYNLEYDIEIDQDAIKDSIKKDFKSNYLDKVDYNIPNVANKNPIESYIPKDINGLIAQYIFITDNKENLGEKNKLSYNNKYNSTYMDAHKRYHESFNTILTKYGLYDIFIADKEGNLVYTDFKEKDFATNLKNGPYKDTGIARVYKKALSLKKGEIAFEDFAPYEPSYNAPASFIATPIFVHGNLHGVLIFQMPVDKINQIMNFNGNQKEAGLGESGEIYLVGSDYKMRNDSRFLKDIQDKYVQQVDTTIGVFKVKSDSTKAVIESQKSGNWIIDDYRGVNVLSVYDKLKLYKNTNWAIIAEIDESEALESVYQLRNKMILVGILASIVSIIIFVVFIKKIVNKPLLTLNNAILNLMNQKGSNGKIKIVSNDEIGEISKNFNNYLDSVNEDIKKDFIAIEEARKVMGKVSVGLFNDRIKTPAASIAVNRMIETINQMLDNTQKNITIISETLTQLSNAKYDFEIPRIEKVTGLIAATLDGTRVVQSSSNEIMALIDNANKKLNFSAKDLSTASNALSVSSNQQAAALEETAAAMEEVTATITTTTDNTIKMSEYAQNVISSTQSGKELANQTSMSMDEINTQVSSINKAITVIDQIAFQTNILSLNAAVEAATAGEAGKGFAVVAGEVRNLAARSAEAAKEIKDIVGVATTKANEGKNISDKMIEGFNILNKDIDSTIAIINEVSTASKEQQEAMNQINDTVTALDHATQENAAQASSINDMSKMTKSLVDQLQEAIDRTSFSQNAKRRACNPNMIFDLNKLKSDHINFKNTNFSCCKAGEYNTVKKHTECDMGKWIIANENSDFAQGEVWEKLKEEHQLVHHMVQDTVDLYAEEYHNEQILSVTENLEIHIGEVFRLLDALKEHNCDLQFQKNKKGV